MKNTNKALLLYRIYKKEAQKEVLTNAKWFDIDGHMKGWSHSAEKEEKAKKT